MGNKRLYRKVLRDFGSQYAEVAVEIRAALAAGDFMQAHSLVHNLKGLAGNLEAKDLQTAAAQMEKLVKGQTAETTSDAELNRRLVKLEKTLDQALDAVRTLGPADETETKERSDKVMASVPHELLRKTAESIKAAVEMGAVSGIKTIAEELSSESDAMVSFCDELVQLAEDFNFDGILNLLFELES